MSLHLYCNAKTYGHYKLQEPAADNADRWDGYPEDRARLTAQLDKTERSNVFFVCGDIHMNYLGRGSESGDKLSDLAWEVCCTSECQLRFKSLNRAIRLCG